jgi:hypothetical protein
MDRFVSLSSTMHDHICPSVVRDLGNRMTHVASIGQGCVEHAICSQDSCSSCRTSQHLVVYPLCISTEHRDLSTHAYVEGAGAIAERWACASLRSTPSDWIIVAKGSDVFVELQHC